MLPSSQVPRVRRRICGKKRTHEPSTADTHVVCNGKQRFERAYPLSLQPSGAQARSDDVDEGVLDKTLALLRGRVDRGEVPGMINYIFKAGSVLRLDSYGFADLERKIPMRPDTIVPLYSMSKCVISIAVMVLIERRQLSLDAPLKDFIPAFANVVIARKRAKPALCHNPITILHLLTHTSGIGYGPMLNWEADAAELPYMPLVRRCKLGRTNPSHPRALSSLALWCDELAKIPLRFQPGTDWLYGYNHDILGRVIEVASGQTLGEFLKEHIFEPLAMPDTQFAVPKDKRARLGGFYFHDEENNSLIRIDDGDVVSPWVEGSTAQILAGGGSVDSEFGGLLSTVLDFSRLCRMLLGNGILDGVRLLTPGSVQLLTTNQLPRATGKLNVWCQSKPGVGFGLMGGSVSVAHPELGSDLCPGEYGWGGMAGSAWTADPAEDFLLISFTLVAFDLSTEEQLRAGLRHALKLGREASAHKRSRTRKNTH